jgi:hypothetical protein
MVQEGVLEAALLLRFYLDEDEDAHVDDRANGGSPQEERIDKAAGGAAHGFLMP